MHCFVRVIFILWKILCCQGFLFKQKNKGNNKTKHICFSEKENIAYKQNKNTNKCKWNIFNWDSNFYELPNLVIESGPFRFVLKNRQSESSFSLPIRIILQRANWMLVEALGEHAFESKVLTEFWSDSIISKYLKTPNCRLYWMKMVGQTQDELAQQLKAVYVYKIYPRWRSSFFIFWLGLFFIFSFFQTLFPLLCLSRDAKDLSWT